MLGQVELLAHTVQLLGELVVVEDLPARVPATTSQRRRADGQQRHADEAEAAVVNQRNEGEVETGLGTIVAGDHAWPSGVGAVTFELVASDLGCAFVVGVDVGSVGGELEENALGDVLGSASYAPEVDGLDGLLFVW